MWLNVRHDLRATARYPVIDCAVQLCFVERALCAGKAPFGTPVLDTGVPLWVGECEVVGASPYQGKVFSSLGIRALTIFHGAVIRRLGGRMTLGLFCWPSRLT